MSVTFPNAGYAPFEATETIRPDELVQLTVRLRRRQYDAQEVVVYGRRPELETSRQSLARHEVERLPGTGGDVIRSVQALPGVARRRCPTRRRHRARQRNFDTRFLLDGIDIPLFHFRGVKSTHNSLSLGSVDLYPAASGRASAPASAAWSS
ncbi:MAG: hypothetical protein IPH86_13340 [bacterium]|nr:hypothetical protein [bacterium]